MIFSLSAFVKMSLLHSDFKKHIHKFKFNVTVQRISQITQKPISLKSLRLSLWPDKFYVLCLIAELEHSAECGLCWEHLNFGKICVDIWFWFLIFWLFFFSTDITVFNTTMLSDSFSLLHWSGCGSVSFLRLQQSCTGI